MIGDTGTCRALLLLRTFSILISGGVCCILSSHGTFVRFLAMSPTVLKIPPTIFCLYLRLLYTFAFDMSASHVDDSVHDVCLEKYIVHILQSEAVTSMSSKHRLPLRTFDQQLSLIRPDFPVSLPLVLDRVDITRLLGRLRIRLRPRFTMSRESC